MYTTSGVDAYRNTDAQTMTREKLIVLLYEKIASNLQEAVAAADAGDRLTVTQALNHSQRIIGELRNALDHEIGGDISRNLEALYDFMFHEHLKMLVDSDSRHATNCLRVLTPLLEAWRAVPVGTGEQAARELARGQLGRSAGPEHATPDSEALPVNGSGPASPEGGLKGNSELVSVSA